jgi:hypothetical protein
MAQSSQLPEAQIPTLTPRDNTMIITGRSITSPLLKPNGPHAHNPLIPRLNLVLLPHIDAMVVTVHIDRWDIKKILINNGSEAEILFLAAFDKMGFDQKQLKESTKLLCGFGGK